MPTRTRSRAGCSTTSRRSSTASASRSRSWSRPSSAAATSCSRTCRAPRRPSSPGRSRSRSREPHASRIQCTPDLQPTDVTGLSIFNQRERDFEFRPGPVFANVVLVDEINRAMPKTQSALLEAMAEQQVTVDGVDTPARRAVPRHGDPEPDRVRRHVPAAGGAARPLLRPHDARLSGRGRREPDRGRAARRASTDTPRADRRRRRRRGDERGGARGLPARRGRALGRRARTHDAPAGDGRDRQLRPRLPGPQPCGARVGDAERPPVRNPGGRRAAVRPRADAPPALPAEFRGRDQGPRLGSGFGGDPAALPRAGPEARASTSTSTSPPRRCSANPAVRVVASRWPPEPSR